MAEHESFEHMVARTCHDIIDTVSSLTLEVELLAKAAPAGSAQNARDAFECLTRIVKVSRELRDTAQKRERHAT